MKLLPYCVPLIAFLAMSFFSIDPDKDKSSQFFRAAADSALLNREEGRLATEKGSTELVKKYGAFIESGETEMLDDMRPAAAKLGFELPVQINQENKELWAQLNSKSGRNFDELFLRMMKEQHQRDVREYKKGAKSSEDDVRQFAVKYLPMVRKHLSATKAVRHGKGFKAGSRSLSWN